jgi:putative ABC transport system ATP-binding protein
MDEDGRAHFRRNKFGVVYQQSNWVKSLNVIENVAFPLNIAGVSNQEAMRKARNILYLFKFEKFEKYYPMELSGGQQQRLSMCRALVSNPWIVMADEPTGNLDTVSAEDLMYDIKVLNVESKRTMIMVTHNPEYERYATKLIYMEDGLIKSIKQKGAPQISAEDEERVIDLSEEVFK